VTPLERRLRALRESGRPAIVAYVTGAMTEGWLDGVRAAIDGGADAIEVGLPFSDPVIDGPVIQRASDAALARGASMPAILSEVAGLGADVPLIAMTYYNLLHRSGLDRAASELAASGISGVVVPDLPLEELDPWKSSASARELATILLVAPSTPPARVARIAAMSEGFVYAVARMAVTGAARGAGESAAVVSEIRRHTDAPVYVGIGISTPAQAADACAFADGVVVGSAIVAELLEGSGPRGVERLVAGMRSALS
jgi:tryptophan synthase alpha chain